MPFRPLRGMAAAAAIAVALAAMPAAAEPIYFDAPESAVLFEEASIKGDFWGQVRTLVTQDYLTYCGVATSVTVLNALEVPSPVSPLYAPYRLFTEDNLFTEAVLEIKTPAQIAVAGMTLEELSGILGSFEPVTATAHPADASSVAEFRSLALAALEDPDSAVVVDYLRSAAGQEGGGHISPLAAYHQSSDRFLLMDVARYKHPPAWIEAEMLFASMNTLDADSGSSRGFVIVHHDRR